MALKLNPEPTFKATIRIPVPGGESEPVEFTFKHRTLTQLKAFGDEIRGKDNAEAVMLLVAGWSLDDAFNLENVQRLVENYPRASAAIVDGYYNELVKGRLGN
jgi:hypothetical protein